MSLLHGRRVLVTGATGGLGPSIVEACLATGARVVAASRRRTRLDELRAAMRHHDRLHVAECDVASAEGVRSLFASLERQEPIDGVVHAAGAFVYGELHERSDDEVERVIASNITATTLVVREALARMRPRGEGRVVVVAADRALAPAAGFALYGSAKAAVVHLTQATALEARDDGVGVNALLPGVIDTPDNRAAMPDQDPTCWVEPQQIAKAAVWLLGADAHGVSGALVTLPAG